jgi:hypothetical protein
MNCRNLSQDYPLDLTSWSEIKMMRKKQIERKKERKKERKRERARRKKERKMMRELVSRQRPPEGQQFVWLHMDRQQLNCTMSLD